MVILDKISLYGHENILSTHSTTIEITRANSLTKKGNCILGVNASKACFDLNPILKKKIRERKRIRVTIKVDEILDFFFGYGNKQLKLLNKEDMVFRKSNFTCNRTALIKCTKSSIDLNRKLIEKLKNPNLKFYLLFEIEDFNE